jgi:glutaminyl-peptide cyclotransferase
MRIDINKRFIIFIIPVFLTMLISAAFIVIRASRQSSHVFDAQRAYDRVKYQLDLGPRTMGSIAHEQTAQWIVSSLLKANWQVEIQEGSIAGQSIKNIIARRGSGSPWVILGSHYDSRALADKDPNPEMRDQPVPGADDGASTVAILLELARVIPMDINKQVWMVFFDDEDNGNSNGEGWSLGSEYFVSKLEGTPDRVVILDMLGDKNLNIYMEENSNQAINAEIWATANELGYSQFIPEYKYAIIDDHLPFIETGIKAADIIDINYAYWHTTQDTLDKISAASLKVVGDTVLMWLEQYPK